MKSGKNKNKIIVFNRKARFNYQILEQLEVGMELLGSEVKSCILGHASISEAYCIIKGSQMYLAGANIASYANSSYMNHNPLRERKLLAHKKQILKFKRQIEQKGMTIVPVDMHFSENGRIKIQVAICRGKNAVDKRESIKEQDNRIEMKRKIDR